MSIISFNSNNLFPATLGLAALSAFSVGALAAGHDGNSDGICPSKSEGCFSPQEFVDLAVAQVKACLPTPADAYLSGIESKPGLEKTPQYVHQLMHPGFSYAPKGTVGFHIINEEMISIDKLKSLYKILINELSSNLEMKNQVQEMCATKDLDGKGCTFSVGDEKIVTHLSRLKTENHRASVDFLRSWAGKIDELSETEINRNLLETHRILYKGIDLMYKGDYRKTDLVVFRDNAEDHERTPENMIRLIRKRGGTQEDVAAYKNFMKKMQKNPDWPKMNPQERKAMSFLGFVPCDYQDVPNLMGQFARELKETVSEMKRCGKIDPVAIGAFVHHKIGEIHPFSDGNGRIARAFMNAILMEYGMEPVVFLNDEKYTDAIEKDGQNPGYFSKYLTSVAIPKMKKVKPYLTP